MTPALLGQCLRAQTPQIHSLPLPTKGLTGQILARPWALPGCPGRPSLPGLSSVPAQGSEEEESCTSEVTTSLSEEVLDLRLAERCQKGGFMGRVGLEVGREMGFVHDPGPAGKQSLVVTGGLTALDADSKGHPRR